VAQLLSLGIIAMRFVSIIVLLLAVLNSSCTKSGVLLQSGGTLSAAERQNIVAVHPAFARWSPSESALWVRHGVTNHVCIREGGIGSLTMPYGVFVFDGDGRVIEANYIQAPNPSTPKSVVGISPLRVAYERMDGETVVVGVEYSQEIARHEIQKQMDLQQKLSDVVAAWKQSGSTNFAEVNQMIENVITNSQR
jgi:hypothetical protein